MPKVKMPNGTTKKFPYTKSGKAAAKKTATKVKYAKPESTSKFTPRRTKLRALGKKMGYFD